MLNASGANAGLYRPQAATRASLQEPGPLLCLPPHIGAARPAALYAGAACNALLEVAAGFGVDGAALGNELHRLPVDPEGNSLRHEAVSAAGREGGAVDTTHTCRRVLATR